MHFIWINRDQKSFEWFVGLLNKIEKEQIDVAFEEGKDLEKVIDITLYMTAAKAKTDIRGAGLQMALSIIHRRDKKDLITGLSTRTQAGRPNWNEVYQLFFHNIYIFPVFFPRDNTRYSRFCNVQSNESKWRIAGAQAGLTSLIF